MFEIGTARADSEGGVVADAGESAREVDSAGGEAAGGDTGSPSLVGAKGEGERIGARTGGEAGSGAEAEKGAAGGTMWKVVVVVGEA